MIHLQIGNFLFAPKPIPALAALVLVPFLASLGFWQLDRADQKREIDNSIKEVQARKPLNLNTFIENDYLNEIYRSALISGHYDNQHQYLLDNRTHQGKAGYHVLTPFILDGSNTGKAVIVNRGWITYQGNRNNIPDINIEENTISISGVIKKQGRSIVLSETNNGANGDNKVFPKLIQSLQLTELAKELNIELLPIVIELEKADKTGFVREWQPYYGSIDKHNAYALQWFAMAGILLFLFIKLNTTKHKM